MRFVTFAQRFVNVFAGMQSRAVVVMANAWNLLLHLLHAHLGTPSKRDDETTSKRGSSSEGWSIREVIGIRGESLVPAYANARRPSATRYRGR
jgi:hypothetical protein